MEGIIAAYLTLMISIVIIIHVIMIMSKWQDHQYKTIYNHGHLQHSTENVARSYL